MKLDLICAEKIIAKQATSDRAEDRASNLRNFTEITPDAAALLARYFCYAEKDQVESSVLGSNHVDLYELDLRGLKDLDLHSAIELAKWNPLLSNPDDSICTLNLNGLSHPAPDVLTALANWRVSASTAQLSLNGMPKLDELSAKAVGKWKGGNLFSQLNLSGVMDLNADIASALCATGNHGGGITLGLSILSKETATVLGKAGFGLIAIPKLERIDAPSLHSLAGLTSEGELHLNLNVHCEQDSRVLELGLGDPKVELQGLTPALLDAIDSLQQIGVELRISLATSRKLASLRQAS